jgi:spore maturation protein CgeB
LLDRAKAAKANPCEVLAAATYKASGIYRAELLHHVISLGLVVVGDSGWRQLLPMASQHNAVSYGPLLAQLYSSATINLNATSLQMPTALNQRIFDVPAAGGFLLTDAQSDVAEHFKLGTEMIVYNDAHELTDLCSYYLTHDSIRRAIIERARERVLREHMYVHRLHFLLTHLNKHHRSPSQVSMVAESG